MYAGLGIDKEFVGRKDYSEKLGQQYNRLLKYTAKQWLLAAIKADSAFRRTHLTMTLQKGIAPNTGLNYYCSGYFSHSLGNVEKRKHYRPEIEKT